MRPRYAKLRRDLAASKGRVAAMVIAVMVALTALGAVLITRTVVAAAASANYASTHPASATVELADPAGPELLDEARKSPGVRDAALRRIITTKVQTANGWRRMLLFVIDPRDPLTIARFDTEPGAWPPGDEMLLERAAFEVLGVEVGGELHIGDGTVRVSGSVHDPALAPATQERTGYGYLTPATAARLGFPGEPDRVLLSIDGDQSTVDATATAVAARLGELGYPAERILVPPNRHPHQSQTDTVTGLLLGVAAATLVLAAILVAATLGGMLSAQTRQIAVMKAVGGTTGQILRVYLTGVAAIAGAAAVLAIGPALAAGHGLAGVIADGLNIDLTGAASPWPDVAWTLAAGLAVPTLVSLVPLIRAARRTVREGLDDHGAAAVSPGGLLYRLRGTIALRNLLRRRTRLALTLALLAVGGGLFTGSLNTAVAWNAWVDEGLSARSYDAELTLASPVDVTAISAALSHVDGVTAEAVTSLPATTVAADGTLGVDRTYPDGGHGSFTLKAVPHDTAMINFAPTRGRWLEAGDAGAVVLNQGAYTRLGFPGLGTEVAIAAGGHVERWRVVGVVEEIGGTAAAYTVPGSLDAATADTVRIQATGDPSSAMDAAERALDAAGVPVETSMLTGELREAMNGHVMVFVMVLLVLAGLMALVGALGLASSMGIAVTERTGEFGVMRAVGAPPRAIRRMVLTEGVTAALLGCVLAIGLGIPLAAYVGDMLGNLSFGLGLPMAVSYSGLAGWIGIAVVSGVLASLAAAGRAARLTVAGSLMHR